MKGLKTRRMNLIGNDGERKESPDEVLLAIRATTRAKFSWAEKAVRLCSGFSRRRAKRRASSL